MVKYYDRTLLDNSTISTPGHVPDGGRDDSAYLTFKGVRCMPHVSQSSNMLTRVARHILVETLHEINTTSDILNLTSTWRLHIGGIFNPVKSSTKVKLKINLVEFEFYLFIRQLHHIGNVINNSVCRLSQRQYDVMSGNMRATHPDRYTYLYDVSSSSLACPVIWGRRYS